jgi:hypothetical protein
LCGKQSGQREYCSVLLGQRDQRAFARNVRLPETTVLAWANSEQVSISGEQVLADGDQLKILVEKDFVCLTNREDEDESDMYPHPEADKVKC